MKKISNKANRIFEDTYREARYHLRDFPEMPIQAFGRMYYGDNECIYTRTKNELQILIDNEKKLIDIDEYLEILTPEEITLRRAAIEIVQNTLNRQYIVK